MKFEEFIDEYCENMPAFLAKYKDEKVVLSGHIASIQKNILNNVHVTICYSGYSIKAKIPKHIDWMKFHVAQKILIVGIFKRFHSGFDVKDLLFKSVYDPIPCILRPIENIFEN